MEQTTSRSRDGERRRLETPRPAHSPGYHGTSGARRSRSRSRSRLNSCRHSCNRSRRREQSRHDGVDQRGSSRRSDGVQHDNGSQRSNGDRRNGGGRADISSRRRDGVQHDEANQRSNSDRRDGGGRGDISSQHSKGVQRDDRDRRDGDTRRGISSRCSNGALRGDGGRRSISDGRNSYGGEQRSRSIKIPRQRDVQRSCSPSFTTKDIMNILSSLKPSQPLNNQINQAFSNKNIDHKNILPNFDPSTKNQRIDVWLKKVNECATVYGWDDRTIIHFAMQKLQGLAKVWYEGLNSILFTWQEWQDKLVSAFPCEQNYGQSLEDMLKRKSKLNEPIEVYYYEKLALLNQCDISGKRAVDCIIHGISDRTMKSSALALRCSHPDHLLQFLMSNKDTPYPFERTNFRTKNLSEHNNLNNLNPKISSRPNQYQSSQGFYCYNCKEKGHPYLQCPKPLLKCNRCNKIGHKTENCPGNKDTTKTMCISNSNPNSKFIKNVKINGLPFEAFIDFGSEVTLIKESTAKSLGLSHDDIPSRMKGFGNELVQSLGNLLLNVDIDGVGARVPCKVVRDKLLDKPMLVGQSYTEQPHVIVYKDASTLLFSNVSDEMAYNNLNIMDDRLIRVKVVNTVNLYGAATVRACLDINDGNVVLNSKIIGKPDQQYFICGGLHLVKNGHIDVTVAPCSIPCLLQAAVVIGRAERVNLINRVVSKSSEVSKDSDLDESQIRVGQTVSEGDRHKLIELLRRYKHCFASTLKELGCTNITQMNIELNSQRPIVYRPYRLSHHEREKVRGMVDDMLEAGVIKESVSEYASPIILVRKKDGNLRMCVDYRMLNAVTVKERYPMPIIEDEIARLSGQACFITLDLASGYYQVPISEESRHLTAFVTPDGLFEFNRMPFGLANAPAVFQRMMNKILGSARYNKATAYIDDLLIFGRNTTECLSRLEEVLKLLETANLTLNLLKCNFLQDKINYLGYEISAAGVRPTEEKIQSVVNFPRPSNVHGIRQFLGLVSYFRKFIQDFARIACPLSRLLKKDTTWEWKDSQEGAFEVLKSRLVDRPVLAIYDPEAETELHTDASKLGIGGILMQRADGASSESFRPVAYFSRQTSPEEKNFHSYELETLAVVCSLKKFRVFLLGKDFKVVTDCSALRSTFLKRDLIPRIARWWLLLQEFHCSIEYRAGTKMAHADALSRNPVDESDVDILAQYPSVLAISEENWLHTLQLGDTELCRIRDILSSDLNLKGLQYIKDNYVMRDNKLFRCLGGDKNKLRWVVPKGARWQLCRMNHDDIGHFGIDKTLDRIKKNYWFSKMSRFVKKYVSACIECAFAKKTSTREGLLHPITKVKLPFHTLHIDHLGPFVKSKRGNSYLLVVIDSFTKFAFIKPVRNTNTQNVIRALNDIFHTFRAPDRLVSDRGSCFTSHTFKKFCVDRGINHVLNAVSSPKSNGQVERYNRTILDCLTAQNLKHHEKEWDDQLGKIQWGLNNTVQKTTGRTPAEVMFGTDMNSEVNPSLNDIAKETREIIELSTIRNEVKDRIDSEQHKQKHYYDRGRRPARIYKEGDLVKVTKTSFSNDGKSRKLLPSYMGPFRVTKALGCDRYKIAPIPGFDCVKSKHKTIAADRMLPWIHVAALELNRNDTDTSDDDQ